MTDSATQRAVLLGLEHDTRVLRKDGGQEGEYTATLSPAWEIWGPNGGYLASIALRAAMAEAQIQHVASVYCQFLRVARFEPVELKVTVLARGRRSEALRVSLFQDGKLVLEGMVRTALPGDGLEHAVAHAPKVPSPESLPSFDDLWRPDVPRIPFWDNMESRVLSKERFLPDRVPIESDFVEWYRFRPEATFADPIVDCLRALILVDTLGWPAAWLRHPKTPHRAPSLDVAAFFHGDARQSEWLLAEQSTPVARDGLVAAASRIFTRDGRLVASGGAQLLCVPAPA